MRKILYIALTVFSLSACVRSGTRIEPVNYVGVGDDVPQVRVTDNYANLFDSREEGIKALIVLFSTTCTDCQDALPLIEEVWRMMDADGDPDMRFIALARGQVGSDVEGYFAGKGYTMPWHEDPDRHYYEMFAGNYIPRLYVVRDGKIEWFTIYLPDGMTSRDLINRIKGTI